MGYVPDRINNVTFDQMLSTLGLCFDAKGTGFYKKIVGGMKCSTLELKKLELVLYLLNRKDASSSLDCIFNGATMPGVSYTGAVTASGTTPYIQTFVNYFTTTFCKDCITSVSTATTAVVDPTPYLLLEDLTFLYLEDLSKTKLE
jgi:hypothetical protein